MEQRERVKDFVTLSLLLTWVCMTNEQPVVDSGVFPEYVTAGSSVRLRCSTQLGSGYELQYWEHPHTRINRTLVGKFIVNNFDFNNLHRHELTVENVTEEDGGTYMCVLKLIGSVSVVAHSLTVNYQDPINFLTPDDEMHFYLSGSNVTLECLAENYDQIQWQNLDSVVITMSPTERIHTELLPKRRGAVLKLMDAMPQDSGTYYCVASSNVTLEKRIQSSILVYILPSVSITPSLVTVRESGNASLICHVSGSPQPTVVWYKGALDTLPLNSTISEVTMNGHNITVVSILHLHSVQLQDNDIYYCVASYANTYGNRVASAVLSIAYCQVLPRQLDAHLVGQGLSINITWLPPVCYGMEYQNVLTINWWTETSSAVESKSTIQDPVNINHYVITNVNPQTTYFISISAGDDISNVINITTGSSEIEDTSKQSSTLTTVLVAVGTVTAVGFLTVCGFVITLAIACSAYLRRKSNKCTTVGADDSQAAPRSPSAAPESSVVPHRGRVAAVYSPCPLTQPKIYQAGCAFVPAEDSSYTIADFSGFTSDVILIPSTSMSILDLIGQGEFGIVFKAQLKQSDSALKQIVAVKTLKGFLSHVKVQELLVESVKMKNFDHPNVLSLIGICVDGGPAPYIVMPFMANGSLLSYLRKERDNLVLSDTTSEEVVLTSQKKLLDILLQIAKGMEYLASKGVLHRDLAARNCMIDISFLVKVADFGLSESVYSKNYFRNKEQSEAKLPVKWMAPESLTDGIFTEKTDVWSFGVTFWEVCTGGKIPYPAVSPWSLPQLLEQGQRLIRPLNAACTDDMYSLMESCWDADPRQRPSFSQLVSTTATHLSTLSDYLQL